MARTVQQVVEAELGALITQRCVLVAENEALKEEVARLRQQLDAPNRIEQAR